MELTEITLRNLNVNIRAHSKRWLDDTFISDAPIETQSRLYFIKFGMLAYEIDGKKYTAQKNQMVLVPERRHIKYYVPKDNAVHIQCCNFNAEYEGESIFDYMEGSWQASPDRADEINEMFERFHRVDSENIILDCLEKKSVLLRLLCSFIKYSDLTVSQRRIGSTGIDFEGVADYIKRNANSKDIMTVEHLAEIAHVQYNYFISEFKRHFGVSPMQYVLDARINSAKQLLEKTDVPIKAIAENMNFVNVKYFQPVRTE